MGSFVYRTSVFASLLLAVGCGGSSHQVPGSLSEAQKQAMKLRPKVIYGDDDRMDLFDVEDGATLLLARSTAAMIRNHNIEVDSTGLSYSLKTQVFGEKYRLCEEEPFWHQPIAAACSGFLVATDTVVTAGHCIKDQKGCDRVSFVFDFALFDSENETPHQNIPKSNLYSCNKLVHSVNRINAADFAVIKLDRPVMGRTPLLLNTSGVINQGEPLFVIGHPVGLPTKVAGGAIVRRVEEQHVETNLDTFGGNSGSAVFNASTGLVEGLLVRGARDFRESNGCRVSNRCENDGCIGEDVTRISEVIKYIQ